MGKFWFAGAYPWGEQRGFAESELRLDLSMGWKILCASRNPTSPSGASSCAQRVQPRAETLMENFQNRAQSLVENRKNRVQTCLENPKIEPQTFQNRAQKASKGSPEGAKSEKQYRPNKKKRADKSTFGHPPFLSEKVANIAPTWPPRWCQDGSKIYQKMDASWDRFLKGF